MAERKKEERRQDRRHHLDWIMKLDVVQWNCLMRVRAYTVVSSFATMSILAFPTVEIGQQELFEFAW